LVVWERGLSAFNDEVKAWILVMTVLALGSMNAAEKTARAILGGGCFWCVEAVYQTVPGILGVTSGYAGGHVPNPTYEDVCTGRTGHAEVVQIQYDPDKITYAEIIDLFWKAHDPTTLNRQGPDTGPQYRSIILYEDETQKAVAEKSKAAAQANFKDPIVTEIVPLEEFYPAEKYHQDFYSNNPNYPYSRAIIRPKLDKFEESTK
jgi:peptide-methionine (S)-S-oxide reductase